MKGFTVEPVPTPDDAAGLHVGQRGLADEGQSSSWVMAEAFRARGLRQSRVIRTLTRGSSPWPLVPYPLARTLLFGLDPEDAHDLTLTMLAPHPEHSPLPVHRQPRHRRSGDAAGLRFPTASAWPRARTKRPLHRRLPGDDFSFVEVGTVTPRRSRAIEAAPVPPAGRDALINRFGFSNDGLTRFLANVQRARTPQ